MAKRQGAKVWLRVLAPMLISIGGLVALRLLGPDFLNQRKLHDLLVPLGRGAPLAFIAFLAVRPVLLLPGQIFTAVGGIVFGTLAATLYSLLGSFLGAALLFVLARKLGTGAMQRMAGGRYHALRKVARRHDFQFALLTCINPLFPTDVMVAMAAASGARFWPTVAGVMLGTIPGTFLTAQFGSGLAQGRTVLTAVSATGMVVSLVLGAFFGRRVFKEFQEEPTPEEPRNTPVVEEPEASGTGGSRPRSRLHGLMTRSRAAPTPDSSLVPPS